MAKKILYKITAYHCPKCGGATEPTKKYCDFCERELLAQQYLKERKLKKRVLIDCGKDFVNFNEIIDVGTIADEPQVIDCTCLEDHHLHHIQGVRASSPTFDFVIPLTDRGKELNSLIDNERHKVRFEVASLGREMACEMDGFISSEVRQVMWGNVSTQKICIDAMDFKMFDHVIPDEVLEDFRCPNCGAPVKSRYGACDYCGGWSVCEW